MKREYDVIQYDVWPGDEPGTWQVNDAWKSGIVIELDDACTDKDIIEALKTVGEIRQNFRYSSFEIDGGTGYSLYVNHTPKGYYPVCELRCISD